jgi:hypothetical protein
MAEAKIPRMGDIQRLSNRRSSWQSPQARKQAMPEITAEQLEQHLEEIKTSSQDDKDELLRDLLVHVYPTKVTQDC